MPRSVPTKKALQTTVREAGSKVEELLDPSLTRRDLVRGLQELDEFINGGDEDADEEDDDQEEEEDD